MNFGQYAPSPPTTRQIIGPTSPTVDYRKDLVTDTSIIHSSVIPLLTMSYRDSAAGSAGEEGFVAGEHEWMGIATSLRDQQILTAGS